MKTQLETITALDLDHVSGGGRLGKVYKYVREGIAGALELWNGEQRPEIKRPEPLPQEKVDKRPPPKNPELPPNVRIKRR